MTVPHVALECVSQLANQGLPGVVLTSHVGKSMARKPHSNRIKSHEGRDWHLSLLRLILAALIWSSESSSYCTVLTFFITSARHSLSIDFLPALLPEDQVAAAALCNRGRASTSCLLFSPREERAMQSCHRPPHWSASCSSTRRALHWTRLHCQSQREYEDHNSQAENALS